MTKYNIYTTPDQKQFLLNFIKQHAKKFIEEVAFSKAHPNLQTLKGITINSKVLQIEVPSKAIFNNDKNFYISKNNTLDDICNV